MPAAARRDAPARKFDPAAAGPLDGITVLDLSRLVSGNMLTLQLADFGADVIKVEPPEGDPLRDWRTGGEELYWKVYGRNKRSIALNLRRPAAREVLLKLVERADVLVENYRPGTLERMGLAPEVLLSRNPGLVVVRISGFGQTGPYAGQPGFGTLVEAMSGFATRTGFPDREPVLPPIALADMIAGLYGAMGVLAALRARDRGAGLGQVIDLSLLESIFSVLGPEAAIFDLTGKVRERMGNASGTAAPRNVYRCGDGRYVALSASTQATAGRLFEIVGRADLLADPRFRTNSDRVANREELDRILAAWFGARPRDAVLDMMRAAGITVGPVYTIADIVADRHFRERGIIVPVEDPDLGRVLMHDIVPRLSATPGVWRRPSPKLGEHADEILGSLGLDGEAIRLLRGKGDVP